MPKFVKIDEETYLKLEKLARDTGYESVEKLLTQFATDFSSGCSVTLNSLRRSA